MQLGAHGVRINDLLDCGGHLTVGPFLQVGLALYILNAIPHALISLAIGFLCLLFSLARRLLGRLLLSGRRLLREALPVHRDSMSEVRSEVRCHLLRVQDFLDCVGYHSQRPILKFRNSVDALNTSPDPGVLCALGFFSLTFGFPSLLFCGSCCLLSRFLLVSRSLVGRSLPVNGYIIGKVASRPGRHSLSVEDLLYSISDLRI